jgi:hypothetical protein
VIVENDKWSRHRHSSEDDDSDDEQMELQSNGNRHGDETIEKVHVNESTTQVDSGLVLIDDDERNNAVQLESMDKL